ncbi:MAG: carboxypeptidase regulatory-like domain-containing protein, partial [Cyclobacteriaceae bacterium]|nr:carboxypeptidase regulatory-like domain-containing protein [Cyclobacteriaceae bacterium HetDA_MAG_MS6]
MRIIITYVLSGWVLCIAQAQSPINFDILVSDELRPVAGALVTAKSLVSGQESYAITDANGLSSIPFRPPVVLEVSHLSYRVFSDTIADYKPLKITLTPADKM